MDAIPFTTFTLNGAYAASGWSEDDLVGSTATLNLQFSNQSATQAGYAPFIDVVLPAGTSALSFQNATYLGQAVTAQTITFDANGHADSPVAKDGSGSPVVITGPAGGTLVVLSLPFGSFTPGQTPADIAVNLGVSSNARIGSILDVTATGGFAYGNSPTGVSAGNPAIFGTQTDYSVVPQVVTLRTIYDGPEQETATGPSYPHSWDSVATIAPGQTLDNLVLRQVLPDGAVFLPGSSQLIDGNGTAAGTITYDAATNTVTGTFTSPETGGVGNTPTLQAGFYVAQAYADPADGTAILDPATGSFAPLTDTSSLAAVWHSTNPANPTNVDIAGVMDTVTAKSVAIQKGVSDLTHGAAAYQPGDTLQYSLAGQVSNYFDVNDLVIQDTLGDGQTFQAGFTPAITIADDGTILYSGSVAADEFTVSGKAADGTSTVTFDVSKILTDNGQAGDLDGGTAASPAPATANVTFETTIDPTYLATPAPSVSSLVDQGDSIGDTVVFSGTIVASGNAIQDTSSAIVTLPTNTVSKSIYAVNGHIVTGPVTIQAGDLVTYDLRLNTPLTSTQHVSLTDYLPLPTFAAGSGFVFVDAQSAVAPALGTAEFGPADTFHATIPGDVPTITTNATSNSLTFDLGSYTDEPSGSYPATTADILYTVQAGDGAFADGLLLTNQVHATETNSFGTVTTSNAIVQLKLGEPELRIQKAVAGTSDSNAVLTGDKGPSGIVDDTTLAADPLADSLSGIVAGDSVSFELVVQNTGSGPNGAFDVVLHDTIPAGFDTPTNVKVTDGAGNPLAYTVIGGGLFDPNGGIELVDPGAASGALAADNASSGANIAVITYDAVAASTVPVPDYDLHNVATITHYAAEDGGIDHTPVTPAANLVASTDVYTAVPGFAKAVVSTSAVAPSADAANNLKDLAIGETATYNITLTLTQGTAGNVTIADLLPSGGTGELDLVSATVKSIGSDVTGSVLAVGDGANADGAFAFGTLTDASNAQGTADQVVVEVTARAVNNANNKGGEALTNTAVLSETNPNDPAGAPYTQSATATEMLVEPTLKLAKTANVSTVQAGDDITYTLRYTNTGTAAAYNSVITDPLNMLGTEAKFDAGSVTITRDTATGASIVTGNAADATTVSVDVAEIDPGQEVDITYTVTALTTAVDGSSFKNVADVTASTLAGSDPASRTEKASGTAVVNVQKAAVVKTLIAGSDPNIAVPNLTAGETGTYELVVTLPHGSTPNFSVVDTLPAGLTYVAGSESIVSVGANLTTGTPSFGATGSTLTEGFGNVQDNGTGPDTAADQIVIEYQATVADTAANANGAIDTNTAVAKTGSIVLSTATAAAHIVAPDLTLSKAASLNGPAIAGTDVTYTLTVAGTADDTSPAYNVRLADLLPSDETYDAGSLTTSAGSASYANGTISFTDAVIPVGAAPLTITYSAHLDTTVTPGELVTNTATLDDDSQPSGGYAEPTVTASATVAVDLTPAITKSILSMSNPFSTTEVVTGETVAYKLLTTVQPGTQHLEIYDFPSNLTITGAALVSAGSGLSGSGLTLGPVANTYQGGIGVYDLGTVVAAPGGSDQVELDVTGTVNLVAGGTQIDNAGYAVVFQPGTGYTGFSYAGSAAPSLTDVKSSLSGTVFTDNDDDGVLNHADAGAANVTVELLDATGAATGVTTTTDASGHYSFTGLELGSYGVQVVAPGADGFSPAGGAADPVLDSIVNATGQTAPVTLQPGADTPNQNAGIYAPVSLSGTVFDDQNADGSQESGDTGHGGDTVQLLDGNGHPVAGATTTTAADGSYGFTGLTPGTYAVQVTDPAGDSFSPRGTSATAPNSIVGATGTTTPVTLTSGQAAPNRNAGVYGPGSLSGTVFTDNNGDGVLNGADAGLGGVTVELLTGTGQPTGTATTTDGSGHYSFTGLHPASYGVKVDAPAGDKVSPMGTNANPALDSVVNGAGIVTAATVSSNTDTPNQNAGVYVPVSIAGVVFTDQNADGSQQPGDAGIAGDTVTLYRGNTIAGSATTGANGAYSFTGLAPGSYTVDVTPPAGDRFSPAAIGNAAVDSVVNGAGATPVVTLTSGQSAPHENAGAYTPATLSGHAFFDTDGNGQQDGAEANLAGVKVTLLDGQGHALATSATNAAGGYSFTGLLPGSYDVQFTTPAGDVITAVGSGPAASDSIVDRTGTTPVVTLTSGQVLGDQNAGYTQVGSLSGTVFTDNNDDGVLDGADTGLPGVTVQLLDASGHPTGLTTITAAGGSYSFGKLVPGRYSVQVVAPGADGFSPIGGDADKALDSAVGSTGRTDPVAVVAGQNTPNQNAGIYVPVSVSGTVFTDQNADGSQEAGDKGLAGDTVRLLDGSGHAVATTTTAADGSYGFTGLTPGTYAVQVTDPAGDAFSPTGTSGTAPNSIVNAAGATAAVTLTSGQSAANQDAGVYAPVSVSGTVFTDQNADGSQEAGDKGYAGDTVQLLDGSGHAVATTTTAADGSYGFTGLTPGAYAVQVTDPAGELFSPRGTSATAPNSVVSGTGSTTPTTLTSGQSLPGQDAGVYGLGGISGNVFLDQNADGVKETGDANVPRDTVELLNGSGTVVATTVTDASGNYSFQNLTPGGYDVQVVPPAGDRFSVPGTSTTLEDSIVGADGRTPGITITSGLQVVGQDAGVYAPVAIAGTAFLDAHCDGTDDYGDPAFKGVTVKLYDDAGHFTGLTTTTDANGQYSFGSLTPGSYQVQFVAPLGTSFSAERVGSDNTANSDASPMGFSEVFTLTSGQIDATRGVGLHLTGGYSNSPTTYLNATQTVGTGNGSGVTIVGGPGTQGDNIVGGQGDNILIGGMGRNTIESGSGTDFIVAGCGPFAQIQSLGQNDFVFGGPGDDLIQGHSGDEYVAAGVGNQTIYGAGGHNTFIANANSGTIGYAGGVFSNVTVGDHFTTGGTTDVVYNKGDGVILIDDYNPANGDTLTVNGYGAPTAIGTANGYNVLYFGPNAAVLLWAGTGPLTAGSPVPGATFNAAAPATAPLTVSVDANGYFTLTEPGIATPIIGAGTNPTITGAAAGQTTSGAAPATPFFGVTIGDPNAAQTETVTVTPFSQGDGTFAALGGGSVTNGAYAITGTPAVVTQALNALQFVPSLGGIQVGQSLTAQFTIAVTDTAGYHASNSVTSLVETRADVPPAITGTSANQAAVDMASIAPFQSVRVSDPDGGLLETATVKLSSTANGTLGNTNSGRYDATNGVFTVSGSAQSVTAALQQLSFTPVAHEAAAGSTVTTGFDLTVTDALGGSASDGTTSVAVKQSAAAAAITAPIVAAPVVAPTAGSVTLAQGQAYTGGDASTQVGGNPNGGNTVTLGNGNDRVTLSGYGNSVSVGTGTDTIDAGYGATVTAAGGTPTILLSGYNNTVSVAGPANATLTGGDGNTTVTLGAGTATVSLGGYGNSVTAHGGTDVIDAGSGAHISATDGHDTVTLHGYGSMVFIGGAAQAVIGGGDGGSLITTASGSASIALTGYGNTVVTEGASDTITDSSLGNSRFDVGGGVQPGLEILQSFAANMNSVVHVAGAAAAGLTATGLFNALTTDASGYAQLALPNNGGTVVFAGLTPNQLHASNFQAG